MRALVLSDAIFSTRERPLLARLEIGLADEGVRVISAVPERAASQSSTDLVIPPVFYREFGLGFTRRVAARQLVRGLAEREASSGGERALDIVHVFGGGAWQFGAEVCRASGAAMAIEVWRAGLVDRARSFRAPAGVPLLFFAPDRAIERALLKDGGGLHVRRTNWGVYTPPTPVPIFRAGRQISILLTGPGREVRTFNHAFEAIARVIRERPDVMLFVDAEAAKRTGLWRRARERGVLPSVSLIDGVETRRDLVLRADVLVHTDARGESRSILLEAMAAGMAVIARPDECVGALAHERTARLVERDHTDAWEQEIKGLIAAPESARALGAAARAYVREEHRMSAHIAAVIDAYEWLTAGPIPFPPSGAPASHVR